MHLTIKGCPRTKKNGMVIIRLGNRYSLVPSKQYKAYEKEAIAQIPEELKQHIDEPVIMTCVYYMETHRRVDLGNLLAATCDILVKAGVLRDDNSTIVASHDGSYVDYDKENPRVEVSIQAYE